jgi:hypothetical protein
MLGPMPAEELLVPFRGGFTRDEVPHTTQFRSTWLSSSLRALRERALIDRYLELLPKQHHDAVLSPVVGVWLPTEVAIAHYDACDALGLSDLELIAIGAEVGKHTQATVMGVAVSLAKGAGVTPWTIVTQLPNVWNRVWIGGAVAAYKLGPKDARIEIAGWPCSRMHYTRVAMRGVIGALVELFCQKAFVRDVPKICTPTTLGYRISWA